jgi:chemotaxis protein MotB
MKPRGNGTQEREIIIKRRSRKNTLEAHGGAWKVAFADFTLAMMALFMVLWLIQPQKKSLTVAADMVTNPLVDGGAGIFDGNSKTPLELDGIPARRDSQRDQNTEANPSATTDKASATNINSNAQLNRYDLRELAKLMESLALQLDAKANIEVQIVPQGLRILVKDDAERFMFERGSAKLNPHFQTLLGNLAGILAKVNNKLIISGHTDATQYKMEKGYNNWNLSGDRALRARNVMVDNGLPTASVLQVTAQADGAPLKPEAPQDGANRRIEILLLTAQAEQLYHELFDNSRPRVDYSAKSSDLITNAQ